MMGLQKEFNEHFKNWLLSIDINDEFYLEYHRPYEPNKFDIWLQYHFDKLKIQSANCKFEKGELKFENVIYYPDYLGECIFPYDITFSGETNNPLNSHHNIKEIRLKLLQSKS